MKKLFGTSRRRWMEVTLVILLGALAYQFFGYVTVGEEGETNLSLRASGYPNTFISLIKVDVTSPNHWVTLAWTGPNTKKQKSGPFHSSPGIGLGTNNCNDVTESNREGSNCTPKGRFVVQGFGDTLPTNDKATYVTWVDMPREIALHAYPEVADYPASHGCIRLDKEAAQLMHNNAVVGKTIVEIDGTWSRPIDRKSLRKQLIAHEGRRWTVYTDSLGIPTIGVGLNLKRANAKEAVQAVGANYERLLSGEERLNDQQIDKLLERDIDEAIENCRQVFPNLGELSLLRQRVLVDMIFNLGLERFQTFKKMIAAVREKDFEKAADEMKDSTWYGQVKSRAVTLVAMMRTGAEEEETAVVASAAPIIDCQLTREEALEGIRPDCPDAIRNRQELVEVQYYSFDGVLHQGQLLIDRALVNEIQVIFQIMRDYRFPIGSVIPLSDSRFRKDGLWDDGLSMEANNTSAFNYRNTTSKQILSLHALGRAIDINPIQNPYTNRDVVLPEGASYDVLEPGTLSAEHPIVQAFLELGWEWGGFWNSTSPSYLCRDHSPLNQSRPFWR